MFELRCLGRRGHREHRQAAAPADRIGELRSIRKYAAEVSGIDDGVGRVMATIKELGLDDRFKVLVGGAPVNSRWAEEIGAHGYAENAMAAVQAVKQLR